MSTVPIGTVAVWVASESVGGWPRSVSGDRKRDRVLGEGPQDLAVHRDELHAERRGQRDELGS